MKAKQDIKQISIWYNKHGVDECIAEGNGAFTTNPSDTASELRLGSTVAGGDYADGLMNETVLTKRYFRPEEIKAVYLKGLNGKEVTSSERKAGGGGFLMFL
jgi:hypothetical protein